MIIRLIFIVITTLLTNSVLASSNNANGTDLIISIISYEVYGEIPSGSADSQTSTADSQTNISQEYNTFELGKEPPVTVWTQFPGPKSNVDKPTVFTSKTSYSVGFASSGSESLSKMNLVVSLRRRT